MAWDDRTWVEFGMAALADISVCWTSDLTTHGFGRVDALKGTTARSSDSLSRKRKVTYSLANDS